jgi:hypothetical protein
MCDYSCIYLVKEREFIKTNENIIKVGYSYQDNLGRFKNYPKGSKLLFQIYVENGQECEKQILKAFKQLFINRKDIGSEYFEGNIKLMRNIILFYVDEMENICNNSNTPIPIQNIKLDSDSSYFNKLHINTFGEENMEYIKDYILNLLNHKYDENTYDTIYSDIVKLLYFNDEHPENHTIIQNKLNSNTLLIMDDNIWIKKSTSKTLSEIHTKLYTYINQIVDTYKNNKLHELKLNRAKFKEMDKKIKENYSGITYNCNDSYRDNIGELMNQVDMIQQSLDKKLKFIKLDIKNILYNHTKQLNLVQKFNVKQLL